MIRFNGLPSFNSNMNGGEFAQPHFQIREFLRHLSLNTPSGHHVSLYMGFCMLCIYLHVLVGSKFTFFLNYKLF